MKSLFILLGIIIWIYLMYRVNKLQKNLAKKLCDNYFKGEPNEEK